jgi:cytochrome c553
LKRTISISRVLTLAACLALAAGCGGSDDDVVEGTTDGMTDGNTDGATDGATDGNTDGATDGTTDGSTDGTTDGTTDGSTDGSTDGTTDGSTDGTTDGTTDGSTDGATDGTSDGSTDGATDGSTDGSTDGTSDGGTDGSTDGTTDGSTDGSSDGTSDGSTDGTTDGGTDGATDGTTDGSTDGTTDGTTDGSSASTGVFTDSPVEGVSYTTETLSGETNAAGEFSYEPGETVTFSVGATQLPSALASAELSPIDLAMGDSYTVATATNIARLLQSLDQDGNPANGITVPDDAAATASAINFRVPIGDFENNTDVINLVANSGSSTMSLVSVGAALDHLYSTLGITRPSGNAGNGASAASGCVGCHGDGDPATGAPFGRLAGLDDAYIYSMLEAYRGGQTQGPSTSSMASQASGLTDQDIADLAAYYSGL